MANELNLPAGAFARIDEGADEDFYEPARLVYHIDDNAVARADRVLPHGLAGGRRCCST